MKKLIFSLEKRLMGNRLIWHPRQLFASISPKTTDKKLFVSPIRKMNIGRNYFKYVNPKRRKVVLTLLNSYFKQFDGNGEEQSQIIAVLDLYYKNLHKNEPFDIVRADPSSFNDSFLQHLHVLMTLDRIASQYCRFEFLEYDSIISQLNNLSKQNRNKAKYIFMNNPNQPNSFDQLYAVVEVYKALEENDLNYLDKAMGCLHYATSRREFNPQTQLEEFGVFNDLCLPNLINSLADMYEFGLKELGDYFETPAIWSQTDAHKYPEIGLVTLFHCLSLKNTIAQYKKIIQNSDVEKQMQPIVHTFDPVLKYADQLYRLVTSLREGGLNDTSFFLEIPLLNVYGLETKIADKLSELADDQFIDKKISGTAEKLLSLLRIFRLTGCRQMVSVSAEDLNHAEGICEKLEKTLKEVSILNSNGPTIDSIIIHGYKGEEQLKNLKSLLKKYHLDNVEVVPYLNQPYKLLDKVNNTHSVMFASSEKRIKEGILLTELSVFKEYKKKNVEYIYMEQGNTAERGGGPFTLTHQKYNSLTKAQRLLHVRTIQGYYYTTEFASKDLSLTFLLESTKNLNICDNFEPSQEYLDFLETLDDKIGKKQRELRFSEEFKTFYMANPIIRTLMKSFNYAGSSKASADKFSFEDPIDTAYLFSDRCSFTHPELACWDCLDDYTIKQMAKFYHENNRHLKYILYNLGFLLKRFDLEFAKKSLGYDEDKATFKSLVRGKQGLERIMQNLGLGPESSPIKQIYNQHLGLLTNSSLEEQRQKVQAYRTMYSLQIFFTKKYIEADSNSETAGEYLYKLRLLQSALANISPFNGKG